MTQPEPIIEKKPPTCYRHADRETWVTCGRCGKPLCPDCMMHGPVGVRCRECLVPQGTTGTAGTLDPDRVKKAVTAAIVLALIWTIVIVAVALFIGALTTPGAFGGMHREISRGVWMPNLLLSGLAGGSIGWTIWRICRRTWNGATVRLAVLLGIAVPLVVTLLLGLLIMRNQVSLMLDGYFVLRQLVAIGISTLFAWLLATNNT